MRISRKDLERFFKQKSFGVRGETLSARVSANRIGKARFAFVVSGPKNRGAALRNLARRRMSAAVEKFLETAKTGRDIVFFMKIQDRRVPEFKIIMEDVKNVLA
ncbi:MAG: ribonuclease P protein component [Candidatus Giovannonibacteria bacterium]|nr:MAG: ribonuclease P protein component [Candidatus Giovannonibacteria bacterium]